MTKQPKSCSVCVHWSKHECKDSEGNSIQKYDASKNVYVILTESNWCYEECRKNWGLPQMCYTSADFCKYYRKVDAK